MVTGRPPFFEASDEYYRGLIRKDNRTYWDSVETNVSKEFKSLIKEMLQPDPSKRPTLADLSKHQWL